MKRGIEERANYRDRQDLKIGKKTRFKDREKREKRFKDKDGEEKNPTKDGKETERVEKRRRR